MSVTIGRIVHYRLTEKDVVAITRRRTTGLKIQTLADLGEWPTGAQAHIGQPVLTGQVVPLIVTTVERTPDLTRVNGQCILDGSDTLWVMHVEEGTENGCWAWPERV